MAASHLELCHETACRCNQAPERLVEYPAKGAQAICLTVGKFTVFPITENDPPCVRFIERSQIVRPRVTESETTVVNIQPHIDSPLDLDAHKFTYCSWRQILVSDQAPEHSVQNGETTLDQESKHRLKHEDFLAPTARHCMPKPCLNQGILFQ